MEEKGGDGKRKQERGEGDRQAVQEGPHGQGGRKEETKNQRRKTKGQWASVPLTQPPELWGCLGDCLQGSGLMGEGGKGKKASHSGTRCCPSLPLSPRGLWIEAVCHGRVTKAKGLASPLALDV